MSENSTRPHSEKGVGPARRPSTRRIGASGLRNKPKWRSMRLKLAAIWRMSAWSNSTLLKLISVLLSGSASSTPAVLRRSANAVATSRNSCSEKGVSSSVRCGFL